MLNVDDYAVEGHGAGSFGGSIAGLVVRGNTLRMRDGSRPISVRGALPPNVDVQGVG